MRAWIDAYVPGRRRRRDAAGDAGDDVLWAADVWYSVKKHWALEAQRLIRARRAALGAAATDRLK